MRRFNYATELMINLKKMIMLFLSNYLEQSQIKNTEKFKTKTIRMQFNVQGARLVLTISIKFPKSWKNFKFSWRFFFENYPPHAM